MPRTKKPTLEDTSVLMAALEGLEAQRRRIEEQIAQLRAALGGRRLPVPALGAAAAPRKRELSPEARRRIAMAQKRRWAEYRKRQAALAKAQAKEE